MRAGDEIVPVADLRRTLDQMELTLDVASEECTGGQQS
jgi:hypothetical protein